MASAQVPQDHQAALDEMVKKAQSEAVAMVACNSQGKIWVLGALKNDTVGTLNISRPFGDQIKENFPIIIESNEIGFFKQVYDNDIKSGVMYSGRDNTGLQQCGWLVAWSNPKNGSAKKVYVDCGPIAKFDNTKWEEIEAKLNKSGDESYHYDPATGTSVASRIMSPRSSPTSNGLLAALFMG